MEVLNHNSIILWCECCGADQSLGKKHVLRVVDSGLNVPNKRHIKVCECNKCGCKYWHHASEMIVDAYRVLMGLENRDETE